MNNFFRLLRPTQEFKKLFIIVILQALFHSILLIASTDILKRVMDSIEQESLIKIPFLVIVFWLIIVAYLVNQYFVNQVTLNRLWPVANWVILKNHMEKFFTLSTSYIEKLWTWRLINIIERWSDARFHTIIEIARPFTVRFGGLIFSIIYIFSLDLIYWVWVLVTIVLLLLMHVKMQNQANLWRRKRKEVHVQISRTLVRQIQSKNEIIQSQKNEREVNLYNAYTEQIDEANKHVMKYKLYWDTVSKVLIDWIKVIAILSVSYWYFWGYLTLSVFVTLMMMLWLLDSSLYQMSRLYINLTWYFIHIEKLREIFDKAPQNHNYEKGNTFDYKQWKVMIKDCSFSYWEDSDKESIFEKFSIELEWMEKTAFVWVSWSWKSTLIKLIAWYLRPDSGKIMVDEQDLTKVSLKSYYKHIWYLTQEPSVFDGTIIDNLTYAIDGEVDQEKLKQCIQLAKCEFIYDFPKWVDTEIWERGIRLSWGQRQRLAIAKIFLKDPKIIILDEPTSALDSFSEEAITEAMHNLFENRTVLIIAHRLQTVKHADDIIVLDQGKVIERGTHDELVSKWGEYAKMLELQSWF